MRRSLHIGIFIGTLLGAAACAVIPADAPQSAAVANIPMAGMAKAPY